MNSTLRFCEFRRPRRHALAYAILTLSAGIPITQAFAAEAEQKETVLKSVNVSATASASGELPDAYAGGQVARGARIGLLGNRDNMETPFSVTAYTAQRIQDMQAKTIADVVRSDASVRVYRGFGNFSEAFVVRGFPLYGDDLGFNSLYGILPRQNVDTAILERVEVFRGANAFLNGVASGNSGIGGNINLVPKRAQAEPTRQITASYEEGSLFGEHIDLGQRFFDQQLGLRVNALHRQGGGAIDDEEIERDFVSLAADWIGEKVRVAVDIGYQKNRLENGRPNVSILADFAGTPLTTMPSAPDADKNFSYPWAFSQTRDTFGTVRVDYDFTEYLSAHVGFGQRSTRENGVYAGPTVFDGGAGDTSVGSSEIPHDEDVKNADIGIDARFRTGPVSHKINVTASRLSLDADNAYVFWLPFGSNLYDNVSIGKQSAVWFAGSSLGDPQQTDGRDISSIAVADTLGFFDDSVLLTLGARRQKIEQNGYDYAVGARGARNSHYSEEETTPSAGVVYKVTQQVSVYANYVEGLQQGATAAATGTQPSISFPPYKSRQKEMGAKFDLGNVLTSVAIFETTQPSLVNIGGTRTDLGYQRNRGLEINWSGEPIKGTRVLGGITLYDAELTEAAIPANTGNTPVGVPDKQGNIDVEWDAPFLAGLTLRGGVTYTDAQYLDSGNVLKIPSWTTVDIGARYTFQFNGRDVVLRGNLDNVTGRDYWESAMGGYLVMGAPRTASLSATLNF